ncbi:HalOD1 output domain-containing protein [Natrarchaeobius oligotrophus]|uniref:Halobacterial output domain-containing protein n=1 Tax=Natrarchaeobius chitinivorans TaxID=1679083 RepID=A0A3N6M0K4_NATCH|nr:HalOD1 output domain-containing protein [Natrarchaeobius chitinivorans]RQG96788.1 hypothetical protein EA472_20285 [Natrarchaeobius chitinivorans]
MTTDRLTLKSGYDGGTGGRNTDSEGFVYQPEPEQTLSEAVTTAVAERSEFDDPIAVADAYGPLYDAVDPAALDALFESSPSTDRSGGIVTFDYAGYRISVDATRKVELVGLEGGAKRRDVQ